MGITRKRHNVGEFKPHVRKGDTVLVLSGRSRGMRGRVVSVDPQRERAIVEGVNTVTKHQKPRGTDPRTGGPQGGGRIEMNAPIHVSNLMVIDPNNDQPTRVAHKIVNGKSVRVGKKSGEPLNTSS